MKETYQYPLDLSWSTEEIIEVMKMWEWVETAYRQKIASDEVLAQYRLFKQIVPSIAEEKRLGKEFEEVSGFSLYRVIQEAKNNRGTLFQMQER